VVKNGARYPIEEWSRVDTTPRGAQRVAVPEKLLSLYSCGATLILNQAHCALPALNNTYRMLTQELGFPTQTNIYITPRDGAGFSKHADEHEVLILQIAGSKYWLVYPPDAPPVEIDLQCGDLLYVPPFNLSATSPFLLPRWRASGSLCRRALPARMQSRFLKPISWPDCKV
jgi:cupin superfamily protein